RAAASPRLGALVLLVVAAALTGGPLFAVEASNKEPEGLGRSPKPRSVFIANLPWSIRGKNLRGMFSEVGTVLRSEVEMTGAQSRGWATVTMSTPEEAEKAVEKFDGTTVQGWNKGNTTERKVKVALRSEACGSTTSHTTRRQIQ
ncbi:CP31B, partial [Symbiodinium sp. CCMP2592]